MTHDEGTEELGALLTAAAPPTSAGPDVEGLLAAVALEVVEADRGLHGRLRRVRRRQRVAVAAAAAAVVLAPPAAWAAQHFLAQTGQHGDAVLNPGLEDGSERIDSCAADFAAYVATLAPTDLPVPPGHSWQEYAAQAARGYTQEGGCTDASQGLVSETMLRLDIMASASGDWGCTLVWAGQDGDRSAGAAARAQMVELGARSHRLSPTPGTVSAWEPDSFLRVSRDPKFVGCER